MTPNQYKIPSHEHAISQLQSWKQSQNDGHLNGWGNFKQNNVLPLLSTYNIWFGEHKNYSASMFSFSAFGLDTNIHIFYPLTFSLSLEGTEYTS